MGHRAQHGVVTLAVSGQSGPLNEASDVPEMGWAEESSRRLENREQSYRPTGLVGFWCLADPKSRRQEGGSC